MAAPSSSYKYTPKSPPRKFWTSPTTKAMEYFNHKRSGFMTPPRAQVSEPICPGAPFKIRKPGVDNFSVSLLEWALQLSPHQKSLINGHMRRNGAVGDEHDLLCQFYKSEVYPLQMEPLEEGEIVD